MKRISTAEDAGSLVDRFALSALVVLAIDLVLGGATQPDAVSTLVARLASLPLPRFPA
jgi:hypothetical protein